MEQQLEQQLEKILPEDLARTFESAYHVITGDYQHIEPLLQNGGTLLRKASQRMTTTQLVLTIAGLAIGTVIILKKVIDVAQEQEDQQEGRDNQHAAPAPKAR